MKKLRKKRSEMVEGDWLFHWDTVPVHTAPAMSESADCQSNSGAATPPPIHMTSCQQDFSCSGKSRKSSTCPRRASKLPGRGSSGEAVSKISLPASGSGLSNPKKVFINRANMPRKVS
jgi:hypothetical protein